MSTENKTIDSRQITDSPEARRPTAPPPFTTAGYEPLARVLEAAFNRAAIGKGKERHANGRPFIEQDIVEINKRVGLGGPVFQIEKKAREAIGMADRADFNAARNEFFDIIVYAAAAVLVIDDKQQREEKNGA